ncbi:3'(2'),5'-bisphosphate nucleotidase CysQ [Marinomonas aquimarina]|uniref:3'(2'),5'-bisphosphate nucleotidase CysQ n=1 Tax=Marinomonas aquimarina TaxID=295068 RepID=A0A1A8T3L5_9GAMM|nr:3'(2'),5'-bisphosphate nucleotidase CysQ [Marinomonas aquimarina]SBS25383.1 3'(2'),5'-bisphosphate nucleotidase CysQ [Marinomonas aquimarina]
MNSHELSNLMTSVIEIAQQAGQKIMEIYERDFQVDIKDDASPLTEADKAANKIIIEKLQALTPTLPILSEEAVERFAGANDDGVYWLVDPLDGTKEFIKRNGEFTVNIALIEQGTPILGVVYAPVLETTYTGFENGGAQKIDQAGHHDINVNNSADISTALRVVGSRSHTSDEMQAWLDKLADYEMVSMGSSLKLCLVAEGKADLYPRIGLTSLWDTAAAHAVVLAAGGTVTDLKGKPLSYATPENVLNPYFLVGNMELISALRAN